MPCRPGSTASAGVFRQTSGCSKASKRTGMARVVTGRTGDFYANLWIISQWMGVDPDLDIINWWFLSLFQCISGYSVTNGGISLTHSWNNCVFRSVVRIPKQFYQNLTYTPNKHGILVEFVHHVVCDEGLVCCTNFVAFPHSYADWPCQSQVAGYWWVLSRHYQGSGMRSPCSLEPLYVEYCGVRCLHGMRYLCRVR